MYKNKTSMIHVNGLVINPYHVVTIKMLSGYLVFKMTDGTKAKIKTSSLEESKEMIESIYNVIDLRDNVAYNSKDEEDI